VTDAKSGRGEALGFAFDNANPAARLQALEAQPGVTNYYLGADAAKWRLGVKSYAKLRTRDCIPAWTLSITEIIASWNLTLWSPQGRPARHRAVVFLHG